MAERSPPAETIGHRRKEGQPEGRLVAAGALARSGRLSLPGIVFFPVLAFLCADLVWYAAGRRFGDRILKFGCRFSRHPGGCLHKANRAFSKYGAKTLLISKFVIGFDAVAVPLAGSAHLPPIRFLAFDALGAAIWTAAYTALGYIFRNQLDLVATHIARMGAVVAIAIAAALTYYVVRRCAPRRLGVGLDLRGITQRRSSL